MLLKNTPRLQPLEEASSQSHHGLSTAARTIICLGIMWNNVWTVRQHESSSSLSYDQQTLSTSQADIWNHQSWAP
jgi:hypothetical protein